MKFTAKRFLGDLWFILKKTISEWVKDGAASKGAALAFYTTFAMAPLLIIVIGIAGMIFGEEAARGEIVNQLQALVGADGAQLIQSMIANAGKRSEGMFATVTGVVALLFGATGVFAELQTSLNTIWEVKPKSRGLMGFLRDRFLSFATILGLGFLLLVSLALNAMMGVLYRYIGQQYIGKKELVTTQAVDVLISLSITTLLFALIYKLLPDLKMKWRGVWIGALITAVLFTLGKYIIGLYLGKTAAASTFGAAGSLAIVLLWIYYSSQLVFLGAEFTQVISSRYGWERGLVSGAAPKPKSADSVRAPSHYPAPVPVRRAARPLVWRPLLAGFLLGYLARRRVPRRAQAAAGFPVALQSVRRNGTGKVRRVLRSMLSR